MTKHLKRLNAPRSLKIHRKESTWTVRPSPGPHPLKKSVPLGLIVRDYLKLGDTLKEAKQIISNGEITIDGSAKKNHQFPVGLMDVVSIPKMKKDYRVLFDRRGKLTLVPTSSKDATWKLCRIENKTILKGKKIQLNLHDGSNKIISKNEHDTSDVLKINFKDQKINDSFKFEKGTTALIIGGSHIGEVVTIQDNEIIPSSQPNVTNVKGKTEFSTLQKYVFPIGKNKPIIELPEVKV